jgi:hypothetical protein
METMAGGSRMAESVQQAETTVFHWRDAQVATKLDLREFPREEPAHPDKGQGWYDDETENLFVWDGAGWVTVPKD